MSLNTFFLFAALAGAAVSPAPAAQSAPSQAVDRADLVDILALDGELFHVQGVDLDRDHIWVTSVDIENKRGFIHQFARKTGKFERRQEISDGPRYHPGGLSLDGESVWVAVAEYTPGSSAVLEEIDKRTLTIRRKILVPDHLGCVAVMGDTIVAGNWDSRLLYVFDRAGKQQRVVENPSQTRYQDIKFVAGRLVASGYLTPQTGAIDTFSWPSMKSVDVRHVGATDRDKPYTGEGMALHGRDLFLVPEDGPSRMFHFRLNKARASDGAAASPR